MASIGMTLVGREELIDKSGDCWIWKGVIDNKGYGVLNAEGKSMLIHRLAFAEACPDLIITGYEVCHTCDNPPCMNPDHLWLGTHAQNMADMAAKGRWKQGERPKGLKYVDRTHCPNGHEYTEGSFYLRSDGVRNCKPCKLKSVRAYRQRKQLEPAPQKGN